jgi:hypothetical protein
VTTGILTAIQAVAQGLSRLTGQHADKPKFRAWLSSLLEPFDDIEKVVQQMQVLNDMDAVDSDGRQLVTGAQLDTIGDLIGQKRRISQAVPRAFFGFAYDSPGDYANATRFGEDDDPTVGGVWYEFGATVYDDAILSDPQYRQALKARIIRNHSKGQLEETYAVLRLLLPDSILWVGDVLTWVYPLIVHDNGGMTVSIGVGRALTSVERSLLKLQDLLPLPSGVRVSSWAWWNHDGKFFGFDDTLYALGFGEADDPTKGGPWAEEF